MKTAILSFLILFTFSISANAQTTLEEYNYVTKGYKVQIESGLDMKKGYVIEDVDKGEVGGRSFDLKVLYRIKGAVKQKAAYMLVYTKGGNSTEYICIPNIDSDKEVVTKYANQLYSGVGDSSYRLQIIALVLTTLVNWK